MSFGKWVADALSEDEAQPSASRLLSSIVVLVALFLLTAVVGVTLWMYIRAGVPTTAHIILSDVAAFMTALAAFVASVVGVLYGVNKVSTAVSDIFVSKNDNSRSEQNVK